MVQIELKCRKHWTAVLFARQFAIDGIWLLVLCPILFAIIKELLTGCHLLPMSVLGILVILLMLCPICIVGYYNYCFIKHYLWDKETILHINVEEKIIEYWKENNHRIIHSEDIREWKYRGTEGTWYIHMVEWIRITLKDDTTIYVTKFVDDAPSIINKYKQELGFPKQLSRLDENISIMNTMIEYLPK